jgi:hypothetical protein
MRRRWQPLLPRLGRGLETCARKVQYASWDAARIGGLETWLRNPLHPNPPTPYPCDQHYHVGNIRFGPR